MISIKPIECNGFCASCYEEKIRKSGNFPKFNFEAVKEALEGVIADLKGNEEVPCLHGGEPLLIPKEQLEEFLMIIFKKFRRTSIQTNGLIIDDDHIRLFRKYSTSVGISLDGDNEDLNYGRLNLINITKEKRRKLTIKVIDNIRKLKENGVNVSVICILRRYNAVGERLNDLIHFLFRLRDEFGIFSVRVNEVIVYDEERRKEEELTGEELGKAWIAIYEAMKTDCRLDWRPPLDFINKLLGKPAVCVLNQCDPWKTSAEICIMGDGAIGGCLHSGATIDGIQALAAERSGVERYEILPQIPQKEGGCLGCYLWLYCNGGCPGAGIDNDWRNRTRFCEGYKMLFEYILRDPFFKLKQQEISKEMSTSGFHGHQDWHGDRPHGDHTD